MDQFTPEELTRLVDYFAQALDPDEVVRVERWIEEQPNRARLIDDLRRSRVDMRSDDADVSWDLPSRVDRMAHTLSTILAGEQAQNRSSSSLSSRSSSVARPRWWHLKQHRGLAWSVMGAIAGGAFIITIGWYLGEPRNPEPLMTQYTFTTGKGERAEIALPDGSTILLNVASRIDISADFAAGNRTIRLSGEGLFTVKHNDSAPFTVVTDASTTRVLGTSFIVRQYGTDTTAIIAVRDGKVAVGSTVVTEAQQVVVGRVGAGVVHPVDEDLFGFETGVLTLKRMDLSDAIPVLNRWYNVDIRVADSSLPQTRIDGQFVRGTVAELSEFLEWTFGFHVVRDGRRLTLYRK